MASPVKLYQKEMHDNMGFFATWFPGDPIEIGDVGVLEAGRFRREMSLKDLGISIDVSTGDSTQNIQYTSRQGTKITTSAGAEMAAVAKAEITIEFSREGAFVFDASKLRPMRLENRTAVADQILVAYRREKWKKEWFLIEALHTTERATIIISEDSSAGLVLVANVEATIPGISLADPKIGFTVASTRGKMVQIVGAGGLRPLYSCLRIKEALFTSPSVGPVRGLHASGKDVPFSRPDIDELLNS